MPWLFGREFFWAVGGYYWKQYEWTGTFKTEGEKQGRSCKVVFTGFKGL